jgi:hypothetical protein
MIWQQIGLQIILLSIISTSIVLIQGFTTVPAVSVDRSQQRRTPTVNGMLLSKNDHITFVSRSIATTTKIMMSSEVDGTGARGQIIFSLALVGCIWLFSIPPEFRRAHICGSERCVANRAACSDCQTFEEIKDGISQYYKNGGGIQFDFSIDPKTIEQNNEFIKAVGL